MTSIVSNLLVFIVLFIVLVKLVNFIWERKAFYILSWKLPGPFAWPIIGNALTFFCKNEDLFIRTYELISKYPSPMRLWLGPKLKIVFRKPTQIEKIMTAPCFSYKDEDSYKFIREFNGNGLISESGPKWRNDRKVLAHLFTMKFMSRFIPNMVNHSNNLVEILKTQCGKPTFNTKKYIQRSISDLINETIMGIHTEANTGNLDNYLNTINRMYVLVHARITKFWLQIEWIFRKTFYFKEQEEGRDIIHTFVRNAYRKINSCYKISSDENVNQCFLTEMLKIRDSTGFADEQDFVHHLTTFYSASEDTITINTSFALVMFGLYPNIQQKAYEEVSKKCGENVLNEDEISKLEYLERCIKDVLRLFPVAPFLLRTAKKDCLVDGLNIPENCSVMVSIQNIHRDPELWETPNDFNPDHFLQEQVEKRPKYSYIPFSAGTRSCVGKIYAMLALKTILASILREFEIEADGKFENYKLKADISVRFYDDQYPVRLKKRE